MSAIRVQDPSLVVLIGISGSGKSTFATTHFGQFETVSSDHCRGLVSNDPNDQSVTAEAFALLNEIVAARLRRNLLTVVDATNVQPHARAQLVALARAHDVLPVAIVLDVGAEIAAARNTGRADRTIGSHVIERQQSQLRKSLRGLQREGFRTVHHLRSEQEIAAASIERVPLLTDRRLETGPFDAIGDVHGCLDELLILLGELGYEVVRDAVGRAIDAVHPQGRRVIFLGDLVDRGPDSPGVLRLAMGMVGEGHALAVPGNHEDKLVKALSGRKVTVSHGLETTLAQLAQESEEFRAQVVEFSRDLVSHAVLDGGRLVVAHAGLKQSYHNRASGRVRAFALYGDTTGESDEYGLPVRYPWAEAYRGEATVLYGHTPSPRAEWVNNTMCLDTGCVFGGSLSALRYPEREVVSVPAARVYYEPTKPFLTAGAGDDTSDSSQESAPEREGDVLDLADVMGVRGVETDLMGRVSIPAENAAGALEVMSRFARAPRALPYLPPTMSPVATSSLPGYLEHPAEAFSAYSRDDVAQVICEEKHMGSRAVLLVCRGDGGTRFGLEAGSPGVAYTRTGRRLLAAELEEELLTRLRGALTTAGIWDQLDGADWVLLDAEIVPWSLKTDALIREQYASVGAAAAAAMPSALSVLDAALARGVEVGALLWTDMAHFAGLVAAGLHPNPVPYSDVVSSTVHKTLGGPRSGLILARDEEPWGKKLNSAVFPGQQGGPLMHVIAAKAVAFKVAATESFRDRQARTLEGAQIIAERLNAKDVADAGISVLTGGTDVHLVLADLRNAAIDGQQAEDLLHHAGITVNRNAVPWDPRPPRVTSGLRIGTPALATRGFGAAEFTEVADVIATALVDGTGANAEALHARVDALTAQFPLYPGLAQ